jgi:hypothetical protein
MAGSGGVGTGGGGNTGEQVTCYKVTARQNASGAKYNVPNTPDYYNCFNWALPWGNKKVQIVSTKNVIDNKAAIHHWILYAGAAVQDGTMAQCAGAHPNAAFISGWAPGGLDTVMPPDIGLAVPGQGLNLEAHYNAKSAGQTDASGVELCVTEQLRPKEAAVHWLGTQSLSKVEATGTCRPSLSGPVTIMSSSPHMHVQGRHMKTIINRANGTKETLIDKPFDFNTQISYETPTIINPGDTLTTTCTYAQPTPFGQGTNQEMCYNFVTAYPIGKLVNSGGLGGILRLNDCTQ